MNEIRKKMTKKAISIVQFESFKLKYFGYLYEI